MRRRRELCILDFDGILLRAVVTRVRNDGVVEVSARAESRAAAPEAALGEVMARLGRVPRACAVLSVEVVTGLVRLPIASPKERSADEIAQMLRWELEPVFAQQSSVPMLGEILEARGDLSPEQTERVLAEQRARRGDAGVREARPERFGSVAQELGFVNDAQVADGLAIQARLARADKERYVCGWSAQPNSSNGEGGSLWLAAGMPERARRWWCDQLAARGLKLFGVYPRFTTAAAALKPGADVSLIEVERNAVAHSVIRQGSLASLQILPVSHAEPAELVCRELIEGAPPGATVVCGSRADPEWVSRLGAGVTLLDPPVTVAPGEAARLAAVAGAARHAARCGPHGATAAVLAKEPGRPLRRRPVAWWAAAVLAAALIVVGSKWLIEGSQRSALSELDEVKGPWLAIDREVRALRAQGADADALIREIELLQTERDELRARLKRLDKGARSRAKFVPGLLVALGRAKTSDVVVDRVVEERPGRVRVEGRAMSEHAVQVFVRALAERVAALSLHIDDPEIRAERGTLTDSYSFGFLLSSRPEKEEDA